MFLRYISVVFSSFLIVGLNCQELIKDCDYEHSIRTYFCKEIIDNFPEKFYGNYHLQCINCNIRTFTNQTFPFTNSLVSFNVTDSGIMFITTGAFSKLSNVQYIYLQNNEIVEIQPLAFAGLRQVDELHLEHNNIVNLTQGVLSDIEVNTIDLSFNKINELPDDIFNGNLGVLILDLSHNHIRKLHRRSFVNLDNIEVLNLSHNKLCHLPLGLFESMLNLKHLVLSDNKLTKFAIGAFSGLRNLHSLDLANNSISVFEGNILLPLNHISMLDITGNGIYYFDANSIKSNAPTLRTIRIDDNLFSCTLLMNIVRYFKSVNIDVTNIIGRYNVQNINGIACTNVLIIERIDFKDFLQITEQDAKLTDIYC